MNPIFRFLKCLWRGLTFVRDVVMNAVFLLFVLLIMGLVGMAGSLKGTQTPLQGDQGALWLNLDGYLADNREDTPTWTQTVQELNGQSVSRKISTFDVVYALDTAATDAKIRGLVLDLNYFAGADLPALDEVGQAVLRFKASGKPVIALADYYGQSQYYLASFADHIYLNPMGAVAVSGLVQEGLYFKSLLDKLEVTPHVFRVGTYKAAVEPFLRNNMSAESRANTQQWLNKMWRNYTQTVADNRQIAPTQVLPPASRYLAELKALQGDGSRYALQRHLVSELATRYDSEQKLTALFGTDENGGIKSVDFDRYLADLPDRLQPADGDSIAVINIEGTIVDGESDDENSGGDTIAALLAQARDDSVKAVILRINSPGGSAFASELIRQEIEQLQKSGKPVVVSMGGMAASGGYWIAAGADYIVADKNTITGSIGIFALLPTFENSLKKWGVYADSVKTGELAETSALSPLAPLVGDVYQLEIEHGYRKFLDIVAKGRRFTPEQADKLAQGRIWLGEEALQHKLVDELGGFDVAVKKARELIGQTIPQQGETYNEPVLQWLTMEESGITAWLRDLKRTAARYRAELFGLPQPWQNVQKQLHSLTKLNDPKGQYLYCLTCGTVK